MEFAPLAARFAAIIDRLCRAVAVCGAAPTADPDRRAMLLRLWIRLRRAAARFATLAAGTAAPTPRRRTERNPRPRAPDLPRRRGWILAPVPEAAAAAGQLRDFLADPSVQTLVGADPRFGRILRPLCRSLGLRPPPLLRLPGPPRRKRRRARRPGWRAALIMSGPFHPPGPPPGFIPPRRPRAPPRAA